MTHRKIEHEIRKAQTLFAAHGEALARDPSIAAMVAEYRQAIDDTQQSMIEAGVPAACSVCAQRSPGACCFREIEESYDPILLLANLLLGCALPSTAHDPGNCYFAGSRGCTLTARYYFCLHYFCPDLTRLLGQIRIQAILATLGRELTLGWNLEQTLRQWLAARPTP